jgi:hypothetical protein
VAVRLGPHLTARAERLRPLERLLRTRDPGGEPPCGLRDHMIIMGYGVGGQLQMWAATCSARGRGGRP